MLARPTRTDASPTRTDLRPQVATAIVETGPDYGLVGWALSSAATAQVAAGAMAPSSCSYLYMAPAMMVVPLFIISIINTFVAGPPLETLVFDAQNAVSLSYMQTKVEDTHVTIAISPRKAMSHYFVFTCYVPEQWKSTGEKHVPLSAAVTAWNGAERPSGSEAVLGSASHTGDASSEKREYGMQLLQPLVGFEHYEVNVRAGPAGTPVKFPRMEFRLTYVPPRFTQTQTAVRAFFCTVTLLLMCAYCCAGARAEASTDPLQPWIGVILLLLLGVNDPAYGYRVYKLGSEPLETASTVIQIVFSAALFLFWLVMADGMQRNSAKTCCGFYIPKFALVFAYAASACALFVKHGRLPDRLEVSSFSSDDAVTTSLVAVLIVCLTLICIWLAVLVLRVTYRLGWKQVEYIYTDREKSFVGMTLVFISLWSCGLVYRALHGQRGSWLMLQLPFLALSNSYLVLLVNAFWPGSESSISASIAANTADDNDDAERAGGAGLQKDRQGLLDADDDDEDE